MRVGFNIGPPVVIQKFAWIKGANILNTPLWNQEMCLSFLTKYDLDAHFQRCVQHYSVKLNLFLETMAQNFSVDGRVKWVHPEGGLFLWITVPDNIDTDLLFFDALKHKIAFVPGSVFYPKGNHEQNHMRVNFSYPTEEQIIEGVRRLADVIKEKIH
jgi:2-aminoadipate transaminase